MVVKVKKLTETAKLPTYGSLCAACADLYADSANEPCQYTSAAVTTFDHGVLIMPGETKLIHTGLSFQPPKGYYASIYARSGLATKQGLRPSNCVGM